MKKRVGKKSMVAPVPGLVFEEAMKSLRAGRMIRRRGWALESVIFRMNADVFVKLPNTVSRSPSTWHPYPEDFLSRDWEVAKDVPTSPTNTRTHRAGILKRDGGLCPRSEDYEG